MVSKSHALSTVCAVITAFAVSPAHAHMSLETKSSPPGSYKAVLGVPHGCGNSPTTKVTVTIPEGIIGVKPMPKPGWTVSTTKGSYARTYEHYHGRKVSDGVKEIVWSGGSLDNEHYDEFTFIAFITDAFKPGDAVYFPARQDCVEGNVSWNETPPAGGDPHALKAPAPQLTIIAAEGGHHDHAAAPSTGPIKIEKSWIRALPEGKDVTAAYLTITNTGTEPDRLRAVTSPAAKTVEIHDMSMDGDVMRMRRMDEGLELAPGASVTFGPGGKHLMFLEASKVEAGGRIEAILEFEKAGKIPVTFDVQPVGASGPSDHQHQH